MSTYTQILYQIIFSTKNRSPTLTKKDRSVLFKYISGLLRNKNCILYQINGVEDHIHIFTHLHPSVNLSSLVKDIKMASTHFIKTNLLFENFDGWQDGYGAFTYNFHEKDKIMNYVLRQEEHHQKISFREEFIELLRQNGVEFDEKYLM